MGGGTTKLWSVYIVCCHDGTFYTGVTTDLARRLKQHNAGKASRYTRVRLPVRLVYSEGDFTRGEALQREKAVKALTRPQKVSLIRPAA